MGLSATAQWILIFVQEIPGVRTDPQGSCSAMHILFLSSLICEARTGPPSKKPQRRSKLIWPWDCLQLLNGF